MWFRILEMFSTPFLLLFVSYHTLSNSSRSANESSCPQSNSTNLKLFYHHTDPSIRGCYEEGSSGPCKANMKFYQAANNNKTGECQCDEMSSSRLLLFSKATNECYPIYNQAFCATGEQLTIFRANPAMPVCTRTVCYDDLRRPENFGKDLVPVGDKCYEVGSTCCTPTENSDCHKVISFERGRVQPVCTKSSFVIGTKAVGVPGLRCEPGTYRSTGGKCQPPIFGFDDDE